MITLFLGLSWVLSVNDSFQVFVSSLHLFLMFLCWFFGWLFCLAFLGSHLHKTNPQNKTAPPPRPLHLHFHSFFIPLLLHNTTSKHDKITTTIHIYLFYYLHKIYNSNQTYSSFIQFPSKLFKLLFKIATFSYHHTSNTTTSSSFTFIHQFNPLL